MSLFSQGFNIGFNSGFCGWNFCMPFFNNPFMFNPISLYMVPMMNGGMYSRPDAYGSIQIPMPDFSVFAQNMPNMTYNLSNFNYMNTQCQFGDFYTPSNKTPKNNTPTTTTTETPAPKPTNKGNSKVPVNERKYDDLIRKYAQQYGVEENFVRAVIKRESGFNPKAKSGAGAMGLMQLMPPTAKQYGVTDPYDPEQCIRGGVHLLSNLSKMYKGDKKMILAAYNWGCGNLKNYGFENRPKETRVYVDDVLRFYNEYNNMA